MARYVDVVEVFSDEEVQLTGIRLDCTERPSDWSEEDWRAFEAWRRNEHAVIRSFLEKTLERCRAQAEANKSNSGGVVLEAGPSPSDARVHAARGRAVVFGREIVRLEAEIGTGFRPNEEEMAARIFTRLCEIERSLDALLDDPVTSCAEAWHAFGQASRLLKKPDAAERAFLEAVRMSPFSKVSWLELTRIRGERGDHAGSEAAARRAVELDEKSAPAWSNLAMSLLLLDRRDEARDAATRGLAIDEADPVALNVLRMIAERRGSVSTD
jgi:tetratricopeptide (TPR) repeat protein